MRSGKNDVNYSWHSDALIKGIDHLAEPLADLFRAYIVHGFVPDVFLLCALTPIVKDGNKSKTLSSNYRLIATSALTLKLFDHIVLELFPTKFIPDALQFGFLKHSSTTMCTWTLNEVINYFTNRGSSVYICLLDMTKAFDTIKLSILFEKLRERIPPVFLRLIIYIYLHQQCWVKWGNEKSDSFSTGNGVRQGAVASPPFFNVFLDKLFEQIVNSGIGCWIDNYAFSILGYADDLTLICPTCEGLQQLINLVEDYCIKGGLKISVDENPAKSKTKCLAFNQMTPTRNMMVSGLRIPWVDEAVHLGHTINTDERMSHDLSDKRGVFIGKTHALQQELGEQYPEVMLRLRWIYASSFYGSNLWDLFDCSADKLYASWNRSIRLTYSLPINTHRFVLQELYNKADLKSTLIRRFNNFSNSLRSSTKPEVVHLERIQRNDWRSTYGRNNLLQRSAAVNPFATPVNQSWRFGVLKELIDVRDGDTYVPGFSAEEIQIMLNSLCTD